LLTGTTKKIWFWTLGSNFLYLKTPSKAAASFPFAVVLNQKALPLDF
jgi:hypothetical protein